jgi:hypothetical protein
VIQPQSQRSKSDAQELVVYRDGGWGVGCEKMSEEFGEAGQRTVACQVKEIVPVP